MTASAVTRYDVIDGCQALTVTEDVDKAKFVQVLAPVNAEFEKQFGKANLDRIRNFK